jgi:hypothetical protein
MQLQGATTVPPAEDCLSTGTPCRVEMAGTGTVNRMGPVTFRSQFSFTLDPANPPVDGCFPIAGMIKARTVNAVACLVNNGEGATLRGDFQIFHGTGTFRGATGRARWSGTAADQVTITGSGTIRY